MPEFTVDMEESRYLYEAGCQLVGYGNFGGGFSENVASFFVDKPTGEAVNAYLRNQPRPEFDPRVMVWVNFSRRALVSVHHPDPISYGAPFPKPIQEDIIGEQRFPYGETLYVVNYEGDDDRGRLYFETKKEILEYGSITPYMAEWLGKVASLDPRRTAPASRERLSRVVEGFRALPVLEDRPSQLPPEGESLSQMLRRTVEEERRTWGMEPLEPNS